MPILKLRDIVAMDHLGRHTGTRVRHTIRKASATLIFPPRTATARIRKDRGPFPGWFRLPGKSWNEAHLAETD